MFQLSDDNLRSIKAALEREFCLGLQDESAATVKMLITYVRQVSRGDETGTYLALDLGGTNFRVLLVSLENGRETQVSCTSHAVPSDLLMASDGRKLFDYIALKLLEFVQQRKLRGRRISLGFTFSFPCKQYGLTQAILVKWNKGYNVGGVIGTDVVKQLKDALKRQLSGLIEAYIDVVAVINDTTGTLIACASSQPDCRIGLIVGTGFNACYLEALDKCDKWPANYMPPKQVVINCEWGAMGDNAKLRELDQFRNAIDAQIDAESVNPNNQTLEKLVSGMYVGEMLRRAMLLLHSKGCLFVGIKNQQQQLQKKQQSNDDSSAGNAETLSHKLNVKDCLDGKHLSMLAADELSGKFEKTPKVLAGLNILNYSDADMRIVVELASCIMHRSAYLAGAAVSTLLERINKPHTAIGYDGSLIKYHPYFLKKCVEKCRALTPKSINFTFVPSSDGSGIGAAVVAAALHKERRPLYIIRDNKLYEMHFNRNNSSNKNTDKQQQQQI